MPAGPLPPRTNPELTYDQQGIVVATIENVVGLNPELDVVDRTALSQFIAGSLEVHDDYVQMPAARKINVFKPVESEIPDTISNFESWEPVYLYRAITQRTRLSNPMRHMRKMLADGLFTFYERQHGLLLVDGKLARYDYEGKHVRLMRKDIERPVK